MNDLEIQQLAEFVIESTYATKVERNGKTRLRLPMGFDRLSAVRQVAAELVANPEKAAKVREDLRLAKLVR